MYKTLLLLTTCVAVAVVARSSPNAAFVEERFKSQEGSSTYPRDVIEDAQMDIPRLIAKHGYPIEVHTVVTSDGYILEMHRIPHGRDNHNNPNEKRPVVLLMHGLLSSSADFLIMGPGTAPGYHLAEAGYDVWLGNARGNYYSRNHVSMNPDNQNDFWKFSWDEIGNFDLPAFIDHILDTTGESKIHYIGHSQGGTAFLVLNSLRPEYNEKLISFQGLAPASFFTHNENEVFIAISPFESIIESAAWAMGIGEVLGNLDFLGPLEELLYTDKKSLLEDSIDMICDDALINTFKDREYYNSTMLPVAAGHAPAGASVRQYSHYGQVIRFDSFRRYNYNGVTNLAVYGRMTPPEYDLSKITVPSYLYYGLADTEVDYRDLFKLAASLPNVVKVNKMERDSFNHFDFVWAIDTVEQVYNDVIASMKDAESR